ncbi:MAG: ATP-binding protein [Pantoea sp.]|nr:ATP-binding protein [Pantoea sp.]
MEEISPLTLTLPARLNSLPLLGEQLRHYLAPQSLPENWIFMLDLALCEAATNIILHGYEQNLGKSYGVTFSLQGNEARITLKDGGEPIPAEQLAAARVPVAGSTASAALAESGRGLRLLYDCVDEVHYQQERQENILTLIKRLPQAG